MAEETAYASVISPFHLIDNDELFVPGDVFEAPGTHVARLVELGYVVPIPDVDLSNVRSEGETKAEVDEALAGVFRSAGLT